MRRAAGSESQNLPLVFCSQGLLIAFSGALIHLLRAHTAALGAPLPSLSVLGDHTLNATCQTLLHMRDANSYPKC